MIEILAHSASGDVFPMKIKAARLTRRYEDKEYAFVASDLKLDCVDAAALYAAVYDGQGISVVVRDGATSRFRGTVLRDGTKYDPESEIYSFPIIHQSKRIFESAKAQLELQPSQTREGTWAFDYVTSNFLHAFLICPVSLSPAQFEFAAPGFGSGRDLYWKFLQEHTGYTTRDFWIDFAKHYRALLKVGDLATPTLEVVPRQALAQVVHTGYDSLIAGYSEEMREPQYRRVVFPATVKIISAGSSQMLLMPVYATYDPVGLTLDIVGTLPFGLRKQQISGVTANLRAAGSSVTIADGTLDLRVPNGLYGDTYPERLPLESVPVFTFAMSTMSWSGESPQAYAARHFFTMVHEFKEVDVLYLQTIPVAPQEQINVRGQNATISEVEDDLVDETTRVKGRIFA